MTKQEKTKRITYTLKNIEIKRSKTSKKHEGYVVYRGLLSNTNVDLYNTRQTKTSILGMHNKIQRSLGSNKRIKVEFEHLYTETDNFYWLIGDILDSEVNEKNELFVDFGFKENHPITPLLSDMLDKPYDFHDFVPSLSILANSNDYHKDYKTGVTTFNNADLLRIGVVKVSGNSDTYIQLARSFKKDNKLNPFNNLEKASNKELVTIMRSFKENENNNNEDKKEMSTKEDDIKLNVGENNVNGNNSDDTSLPNSNDVNNENNEVVEKEEEKDIKSIEVETTVTYDSFKEMLDDAYTKLNESVKENVKSILNDEIVKLTDVFNKEIKKNNNERKKEIAEVKRSYQNELNKKEVEYLKRTPATKLSTSVIKRSAMPQINDEVFIESDGLQLTKSEWNEFANKAQNGQLTDGEMSVYKAIEGAIYTKQQDMDFLNRLSIDGNANFYGGVPMEQYQAQNQQVANTQNQETPDQNKEDDKITLLDTFNNKLKEQEENFNKQLNEKFTNLEKLLTQMSERNNETNQQVEEKSIDSTQQNDKVDEEQDKE